jgi:hypothetical protein
LNLSCPTKRYCGGGYASVENVGAIVTCDEAG